MSANEVMVLDSLIAEMKAKEEEAKALLEEVEACKMLVRETLESEGLSELRTAKHTIKYSSCERTNIDKKILQTEFPDIFGKVAKVSCYKMLKIS